MIRSRSLLASHGQAAAAVIPLVAVQLMPWAIVPHGGIGLQRAGVVARAGPSVAQLMAAAVLVTAIVVALRRRDIAAGLWLGVSPRALVIAAPGMAVACSFAGSSGPGSSGDPGARPRPAPDWCSRGSAGVLPRRSRGRPRHARLAPVAAPLLTVSPMVVGSVRGQLPEFSAVGARGHADPLALPVHLPGCVHGDWQATGAHDTPRGAGCGADAVAPPASITPFTGAGFCISAEVVQ